NVEYLMSESNAMTTEDPTDEPESMRQFSLASMMTFMLACAAYLGLLVSSPRYFDYLSQHRDSIPRDNRRFSGPRMPQTKIVVKLDEPPSDKAKYAKVPLPMPEMITFIFSWLLLGYFYRSWNLSRSFAVHLVVAAIYGVFGIIVAYGMISSGEPGSF